VGAETPNALPFHSQQLHRKHTQSKLVTNACVCSKNFVYGRPLWVSCYWPQQADSAGSFLSNFGW